jgi:hypothetical protein
MTLWFHYCSTTLKPPVSTKLQILCHQSTLRLTSPSACLSPDFPVDCSYRVSVYTGGREGASTTAKHVYLTLVGNLGRTDQRQIRDAPDNFKVGGVHTFEISCPDIGAPVSATLEHDNTGQRPAWFVDRVRMHTCSPRFISSAQLRIHTCSFLVICCTCSPRSISCALLHMHTCSPRFTSSSAIRSHRAVSLIIVGIPMLAVELMELHSHTSCTTEGRAKCGRVSRCGGAGPFVLTDTHALRFEQTPQNAHANHSG